MEGESRITKGVKSVSKQMEVVVTLVSALREQLEKNEDRDGGIDG